MTGIVTGLGWPLLAAFIIGLVALAVKEPKKFQRIDNYLYWAGIAVMATVGGWQLGYTRGYEAGRTSAERFSFADPMYSVIGIALWMGFLFALHLLSNHLNDE